MSPRPPTEEERQLIRARAGDEAWRIDWELAEAELYAPAGHAGADHPRRWITGRSRSGCIGGGHAYRLVRRDLLKIPTRYPQEQPSGTRRA